MWYLCNSSGTMGTIIPVKHIVVLSQIELLRPSRKDDYTATELRGVLKGV